MSRLIDADKLELDAEWSDYYNAYMAYSSYQINGAVEVQAIQLDKVKQAREEIDNLDRHFDNDYFSSNRDAMFKCNEVLEILDKLIAESEDE
jgi:hypothetical protein